MKLTPPATYKAKPHALVIAGHRMLYVKTMWGDQTYTDKRDVEAALQDLAGHVVYTPGSLHTLRHTTGARSWVMSTWRGRETRMTHTPSGTVVTSLRGALNDAPDMFRALSTCLSWLSEYGVSPGSVSTMAWNLLEASLSSTVQVGFDPELGRAAFYGGRQEVRDPFEDPDRSHWRYQHQKLLDIRAAYPTAMARAPIALSLREVPRGTELTDEPGLAAATVYVPESLPYAPLPVRVAPHAIQFQLGGLEGVWPWTELKAARDLGCIVGVTRCFAPRRTMDLFGPWWIMAQTGRNLPNGADALAKAISVCCWGQFAMQGDDRADVMWSDEEGNEPYEVPRGARALPHRWAMHIAAEVTARVRVQTLVEGIYGLGCLPVHVDTDGVIVRRRAKMNDARFGSGFGQWRVKHRMPSIEIKAPQFYRWTCNDQCGEAHRKWHYVASGMNEDGAIRQFEDGGRATRVSYLSREDAVLPSCSSSDQARIQRLLDEARGVGVRV
jgi:hypothetical protein